ncbi:MAG TPA: hypothetical protein VGM81_02430 [Burkholderiaceae bacterium]|jgi:hypothetical protein
MRLFKQRFAALAGLLCAMVAMVCAQGLAGAPADDPITTPVEHRRTPDQTFLTFPEWYLVHSPAEYAAYLHTTPYPSGFPFFAHIGQFWQGYAAVTKEIERYPFNGGYHLMVMVIGVSTTVEYTLKGLYEHTLGRLTEASKSRQQVPEEVFAARYAQAYVDFIRVDPWYKFDFRSQLRELWKDVPLSGPDLTRRWERRYLLSSELLVKEGYARLIKLGTQSIYDAPKPVTAVVLSKAPVLDPAHFGDYAALAPARGDGSVLATIPRYEGFSSYSRWLAGQGIDFKEIAGNDGEVLVSEWVPLNRRPDGVRLLFEQPILTQANRKRIVFAVPIARLSTELRRAQSDPVTLVEHVYDF